MKKLSLLLVLVVSLSSCAMDIIHDQIYIERYSNYDLYYSDDFQRISSPDRISSYIRLYVDYQSTEKPLGPEETLKRGYGDCKDFSLLYLNILYVRFGIKGELVLVDSEAKRAIGKGGVANHAIVRMPDGRLIEPQNGKYVNFDVAFYYDFDLVFN